MAKLVFTDQHGQIYSWIRQGPLGQPMRPHAAEIGFPGGKCEPSETLLQAAHRELSEEIEPYGPKLRRLVEAAVLEHTEGHSIVSMTIPDKPEVHRISIWGIPLTTREDFTTLENSKHVQPDWRSPLDVWPTFRGYRTPYGTAARLA